MQGIRLVCPPYHQYHTVPLADAPPPLGTAAACHFTEPDCLPFLLAGAAAHRPWIPLLVLAPPAVLHAAPSLQNLVDRVTAVPCATPVPYTTPDFPGPDTIMALVRDRPMPSPHLLARWLAERLGKPDLLPYITSACGATEPRAPAPRTVRRRLAEKIHCAAGDLHRLAVLARLRRPAPSHEALAFDAQTTVTRLRERVQRGLGVSLTEFNAMPGWEWVLEAAVRQGLGAGGWGLGADRRSHDPCDRQDASRAASPGCR